MKFNQMMVQQIWFDNSNLLQLPFLQSEHIEAWKKKGVTNLDDFFELEDEDREDILSTFSSDQVEIIAESANRYPSIMLEAEIVSNKKVYQSEEEIYVSISIERDNLDEEDLSVGTVSTNNRFLRNKEEFWWIVIGDKGRNLLFYVKKVKFVHKLEKKIEIEISEEGDYNLSVFLICDSYLGCDNEIQDLKVKIIPSENAIAEEDDN
jgi:pre-mRNA-splicing helicase BRR2